MKHLFSVFTLATSISILLSCNSGNKRETTPGPGNTTDAKKTIQPSPPLDSLRTDTLMVDDAMIGIANYGAYCNTYLNFMTTPPTRSFLIGSNDLASLLGVTSYNSNRLVRIYIGINTNSARADTSFHLYLVPISQVNSTPATGYYADSIPQVNGKQYVYDLTTPCPKTCDEFSKLYEAFTNASIVTINWPAR